MSRGPGALQRRLCAKLEAAAGQTQSAAELIGAILLEGHPKGELAARHMASAVRRALRSLKRRKLVHRITSAKYPEGHAVYRLGPEPEPVSTTTRTIRVTVGPTTPLLPPTVPAYIRGEDGELHRVDHPTGFPMPVRRRR